MQVDWTTFVLEIVNFLVLVWILKRFLYAPVLKVLRDRRAGIERTLAEANQTEARASALAAQFESRLADWEREKASQRARFDEELSAERVRQMQLLEKSLAEERERSAAQVAHQLEQAKREIESQAVAQAGRFTQELVSRLAGPELEARLVNVFLEDWSRWPEERFEGLQTAASEGARASIVSAWFLPEDSRRRVAEALTTRLGPMPLEFSEDRALIAGLRVSVGAWQMRMTLADELGQFAAAANHVD